MEIFDYVIVGAGSAGCVVARRLSDDPKVRVLLLEAGPPANDFWIRTPAGMGRLFANKRYNWSYFTEPVATMRQRKVYWPRGKALGGSSSVNGMVYIRGHRLDFDNWAKQGNPGWSFEEVLPYFRKMEHNEPGGNHYRGTGGPLWISDPAIRHPSSSDFIEAANSLGIPRSEDLNGELHDGIGFVQHNIRRGKRQSAYVAYIEPVRHRANLVIRTGVHVSRVLFEGRVASGVEVIEEDHLRTIHAAREVILCAGALNSPHLLMLSGVGDSEELQKLGIKPVVHLPGVGKNLRDHFYVHLTARSKPDSSYNRRLGSYLRYWEGLKYITTGKSYLALGSSQVVAFVKSRPEQEYGDLQISFRPMTHQFYPDGSVKVHPYPAVSASVYGVRPASTGFVELRSPDPLTPPAFVPNYLTEVDDVRAMIAGLRLIRSIMATPPMAARVTEETAPGPQVQSDEQLLAFMEEYGNCAYHPAGTCKMGRDALAVVDDRLKVRGLERLRVIDASIMPQVTSGNTNAPTMMIGEKGAHMVSEDQRSVLAAMI